MPRVYAVIMAGGRGERFWPLSTEAVPKPFIPLLGETTLLQDTVARLHPLIPADQVFLSIGEAHESMARKQLPQLPADNFIVEPVGRDTSACLGYCALHLEKRDPDGIMLAIPADHFIADSAAYQKGLNKGIENLAGATAVVFGMPPTRPDTGYGYIQAEKPAMPAEAWPVMRFVEKPDAATAKQYLQAGNFFWNSGMFLWENRTLLRLFQKLMPETWKGLDLLRPLIGRPEAAGERLRIFSRLQRISIDYGILERTSGLRLIPSSFAWDDIGNWASLSRALPGDAASNCARGGHFALDSSGCITYSDSGTIAAFGIKDLVIVQANGKVLVCPKDRAGELKKLLAAMADNRPQ